MFPFRTVTHPTSDIRHPTILLHTSQGKRYLFGKVPEGLQRSLNEQKIRVSKLSGIFLTGKLDWESMGGLPGMILTVSDQGKKDLNIYHGSNVIDYIVSTWRYFVFRFGMDLRPTVIPNNTTHQDEIMDIRAVVLEKSSNEPNQPFSETLHGKLKAIVSKMFPLEVKNNIPLETDANGEYTGYDTEDLSGDDQLKTSNNITDPTLADPHVHVRLPDFSNTSSSTSYSIQLHSVRGKFNPKKAIELGVPKGPSFARLANGEEVILENGTIIMPNQVLSEQRIFQTILIVDIPSVEYLTAAKSADWGSNAGIVYHLLGEDIEPFEAGYMEFINSFGPDCTHYISHRQYCPNSLTFKGSANVTMKLKALQPTKFNLPETHEAIKSKPSHVPSNIHILLQGQIVNAEATIPSEKNKYAFDNSFVKVKTAKDWDATFDSEVAPLGLETSTTKQEVLDLSSVSSTSFSREKSLKDQVETITFGTGSALPSKYRNVISNLVRLPYRRNGQLGFRSILLDAGENTIGAMKRTLQLEQMESYMKELQIIYLSHLHADHHLGIISIIKEWLKFNSEGTQTLYLVSPWQYEHFVEEWMKVESDLSGLERVTHISCEDFLAGRPRSKIAQIPFENYLNNTQRNRIELVEFKRDVDAIKQMYHDTGLKSFKTCRAYHCNWAYSCSITYKLDIDESTANDLSTENSFKVSYSGDTRPNLYKFANMIGKKSDLLIHEATLENDLLEEAKKKRHCTINEAIEVSKTMEARKLILTHFSQRYPQLPGISNNTVVDADYCFAFDSMIVKYDEIGDQIKVFDQLDIAFATEQNEMDEDE